MKRSPSIARIIACIFSVLVIHGTVLAESPKELVFVFQKQKNPDDLKQAAGEVSKYLSKELGIPVRTQVPTGYAASVQALVSKKADFAYTSSLPFLLARRDGGAELILVEQREDTSGKLRTEYDSVFVVRADSPLKDFSDLAENSKDLRMVFTSPTSTSGYVFAYWRFVNEKLLSPKQDPKEAFKSVSFGGSYSKAIEEVLASRADVAAVSYYVVEGPKADNYFNETERKKLRVIARTPGVPTHLISARAGLDEELKEKVKAALLKLSKEKPELLSDVYGTSKFLPADENEHVKRTIEAVEYLGLPIEDLAK